MLWLTKFVFKITKSSLKQFPICFTFAYLLHLASTQPAEMGMVSLESLVWSIVYVEHGRVTYPHSHTISGVFKWIVLNKRTTRTNRMKSLPYYAKNVHLVYSELLKYNNADAHYAGISVATASSNCVSSQIWL